MKPKEHPISIIRGDFFYESFRVRHTVWQQAYNDGLGGWAPGPYRDLTGWTGVFTVSTTQNSADVLRSGNVQILNQNTHPGGVQFSMEDEITTLLPAGILFYRVRLIDLEDRTVTFLYGPATVMAV